MPKKIRVNIKVFDKHPFRVTRLPAYFYLVCCDCKLRYLVVMERYGKGVRVGFGRDNYGTILYRKVDKLNRLVSQKPGKDK